ncbi:MAG: porin [bacterium]
MALLALAAGQVFAVRVSPRSAAERLDIDGYVHVQWQQDFRACARPKYGFVLRRARVEFEYRFDERAAAVLELGADRLELTVKDAFVEYRVGRPLRLAAGLRKMPFSLEELTPARRLLMIERTTVNDAFGRPGFLGRDIGLTVEGELFERTLPVGYALGVYNGTRGRLHRDYDDAKQFVERLTVSPARWLTVGLNATQRNDSLTGELLHAGGGDFRVRAGGLLLEAELLAARLVAGRTMLGGYLAGSYRLGPFEPGLRLERLSADNPQTALTAGLNWHLHRRMRLKANWVSEFAPAGRLALVEAQAGF